MRKFLDDNIPRILVVIGIFIVVLAIVGVAHGQDKITVCIKDGAPQGFIIPGAADSIKDLKGVFLSRDTFSQKKGITTRRNEDVFQIVEAASPGAPWADVTITFP